MHSAPPHRERHSNGNDSFFHFALNAGVAERWKGGSGGRVEVDLHVRVGPVHFTHS